MDCSHGYKSAELKGDDQNLVPFFNEKLLVDHLDKSSIFVLAYSLLRTQAIKAPVSGAFFVSTS